MKLLPLSLLLATVSASAATIILEDRDFNSADWTTTVVNAVGPVSQSTSQSLSGGNPGTYLRHELSYGQRAGSSAATISVASINNLLSINPAISGAIETIQFDFDLISLSRPSNFLLAGFYRPYLSQNGSLFVAQTVNATASSTTWAPISSITTSAADWTPVAGFGSGSIDFSSSGAPIFVGYNVRLGIFCPSTTSFCAPVTAESGIDNFKVTITTVDPISSEIPEPTALTLLPASLLVLAGLHRHRRARHSFAHAAPAAATPHAAPQTALHMDLYPSQ